MSWHAACESLGAPETERSCQLRDVGDVLVGSLDKLGAETRPGENEELKRTRN